jgi:flagellar protein FlaI
MRKREPGGWRESGKLVPRREAAMKKITRDVQERKGPEATDPFADLNTEKIKGQVGVDILGQGPPNVKSEREKGSIARYGSPHVPPSAGREDQGSVITVAVSSPVIATREEENPKSESVDLMAIFREVSSIQESQPEREGVEEDRERLRTFSLGGFLEKRGIHLGQQGTGGTPLEGSERTLSPASPGDRAPQGTTAGRFDMGKLRAPLASLTELIASARLIRQVMNRFKPPQKEISTLAFDPGPFAQPSFEGSLRGISLTYAVDAPYQFVHISFSLKEGALVYSVVEPGLSQDEKDALSLVEKAFGKMIVSNAQIITPAAREVYLRDRYLTILKIFDLRLSEEQRERIFFHLKRKYLGYGRIDALMKDRYIEDISCNGPGMYLYILHRIYGSIRTDVIYDEVELNNFVLRLAQVAGRHISLLQPIRDISLPEGNRANLTLGAEVTKKGSTFTIRKFRANPISPVELVEYGTIDPAQLAYLWILMEYKRSILVSGGTATGKTTLLNVLCSFIPPEFKIVSIEDTAELNLMHPNWIQSVSRSGFGGESSASSLSGVTGIAARTPGDISLYDLLVAALRQRPEFIIVGEVRGGEAFTLFQAIAVGHAALGTIHAGSMDELLARVESNPMNVPRTLLANLDAVIFAMNLKRGDRSVRRIVNIVEVLELDRETREIVTNTAFKWVPENDTYQFQGRSFLFDKIRETHGVEPDILTRELVDRANLITWMQKHGIREYGEVTELVRTYYRDKAEIEALINSDPSERLGI